MPVPRVCVGCQRGFGLLTNVRRELVDPRWQRLFHTLHDSRPSLVRSDLSRRLTPLSNHRHPRDAATRFLSTSASTSASASPTQPAILPSSAAEWRAIRSGHVAEPLTAVVITGAAASTWLQGLITADMATIDTQQRGYTAVLNFKGRVVFTALVLKPHSDQSTYQLLLPTTMTDAAVTHLGKLNFRRKVAITTQPTTLYHILPDSAASPSSQLPSQTASFPDPRTPLLGSLTLSSDPPPPPPLYHSQVLELLRHLHCIPSPGSAELAAECSLPLDCNLDHLHAIAFNKGCYIGQEVTARAHYTGTIRKRLYAAYLTQSQQQPHTATHNQADRHKLRRLAEYRTGGGLVEYGFIDFNVQLTAVGGEEGAVGVMAGGKEVGKLYSSCFNVAIVQLRTESVARGDKLTVTLDGQGWTVVPYELDWWPTETEQHAEDEKGTVFVNSQPTQ